MTDRSAHGVALRKAAASLADEFEDAFDTATVEQFVYAAYDRLAPSATVASHLPLLAEKFARQQLAAAAKIEAGDADKRPTVLFLCVHNAGRSQMALGLFKHLAGDRAIAWSGGSGPSSAINPSAVEVMAERGIDITGEFPKPWTDEILGAADVVITMGCGDTCPIFPGKRYEDWRLEDPAGQGVESVRPIADQIEQRVRILLGELGVEIA